MDPIIGGMTESLELSIICKFFPETSTISLKLIFMHQMKWIRKKFNDMKSTSRSSHVSSCFRRTELLEYVSHGARRANDAEELFRKKTAARLKVLEVGRKFSRYCKQYLA